VEKEYIDYYKFRKITKSIYESNSWDYKSITIFWNKNIIYIYNNYFFITERNNDTGTNNDEFVEKETKCLEADKNDKINDVIIFNGSVLCCIKGKLLIFNINDKTYTKLIIFKYPTEFPKF
jgi:hypothetical protein